MNAAAIVMRPIIRHYHCMQDTVAFLLAVDAYRVRGECVIASTKLSGCRPETSTLSRLEQRRHDHCNR